jgi:hypothetical protein
MAIVLCNAGPLIVLGKLNRLDLLADLYGQVEIPSAVYAEAVTQGLALGAADARTIRLFWQATGWPIVEVPAALLATYKPPASSIRARPKCWRWRKPFLTRSCYWMTRRHGLKLAA